VIVPEDQLAFERAAAVIFHGGLIAFRTDTFYGLGVDPLNATAVARLKTLKGREDDKPILVLIADASALDRLVGSRSEVFDHAAKRFWPGPVTIIGPATTALPHGITAGTETVGVRLPEAENVRVLVRQCGGVLTATSANLSGSRPARTAQEVSEQFPTGIDLIINGGEVTATEPSTVLDVTGVRPRIIREGAVSREMIEEVLGVLD
jgi:L-threonylcarbamoyladenylate synthase